MSGKPGQRSGIYERKGKERRVDRDKMLLDYYYSGNSIRATAIVFNVSKSLVNKIIQAARAEKTEEAA